VARDQAFRQVEQAGSDLLSASFDFYRDIRDAVSEAQFFSLYGGMFSLYLADKAPKRERATDSSKGGEQPAFVKEALAAIASGGYPEAVARAGFSCAAGEPLPLARLQLKKELLADYRIFCRIFRRTPPGVSAASRM
jgi:hypothetical protein